MRTGRSLPRAPLGMSGPRRRHHAARSHQRSRRCPPRAAGDSHAPGLASISSSYDPPYAAIVVDANTGAVLHAANPDAPRHPASLTKIMTLYLLFERLEVRQDQARHHDAGLRGGREPGADQARLKPGDSLKVEDAIKGLVTKSANDAAVVVAEALGGSADEFAA